MVSQMSLARQIIEDNSKIEPKLAFTYVEGKSDAVDANDFERRMLEFYWSLSFEDRQLYGRPDFNTVRMGIIYTSMGETCGVMLLHSFSITDNALWVSVAVSPDYRGTGLTSKMFKDFVALFKEHFKESNCLHWSASVENKASIKLAGKLGFRRIEAEKESSMVFFKKTLSANESATKDNIRRKDKSDGILYSGPASFIVDKVTRYDNSGDIVVYGRVGDYPEHFSGAKFISTNIASNPQIYKYLQSYVNQPNGAQVKRDVAEFKKQDKYNYLRVNLNI